MDIIQPWWLSGLGCQQCLNTVESKGSDQEKSVKCDLGKKAKCILIITGKSPSLIIPIHSSCI